MKSIKLFLLAIIAVCFCTNVSAYELGETTMVDGYPAIVIYVDESGEHGLFMTGTALTEEQFTNMQGETTISGEYAMPYISYPDKMNVDGKLKKLLKSKLLPNIGGTGLENMQVINQFCEENSLDMATYFPLEYWATQLGDGWYIPGADEIKYFRILITGEGPAKSTIKIDPIKQTQEKIDVLKAGFDQISNENSVFSVFPTYQWGVYSSTFNETLWSKDKQNKKYIHQEDHFVNVVINGPMEAAKGKKYGAKDNQASPVERLSLTVCYLTNKWWAQVVAVKKF